MSDSKGRKWHIVINNPLLYGLTNEAIIEILLKLAITYFCLSNEISESGTPHTHIFIYAENTIRFSTLKSKIPTAHIDKAYGTCVQNRDYIAKTGKWKNTDKANTAVPDSFFEWGIMPTEGAEKSPKNAQLLEEIHSGKSTAQIISDNPNFAFRLDDIDRLRQLFLREKYMLENRKLDVTYLFGDTGAGKTRSIFSKHSPLDIYRITHYDKNGGMPRFDNYCGQDVLVFEEFDSQPPITVMLNLLDIYPLMLPARYADKVACFTKVYITSNSPLHCQYPLIQQQKPETWNAFNRRIHHIIEFKQNHTIITHK